VTHQQPIKRALISVYDKSGLEALARDLDQMGIELISTGGTRQFLITKGFDVTPVSEVTGFPEILSGRVKTLHPNIHGAILAKRSDPDQMDQLRKHAIQPIDLVIVNLYPFEHIVARSGVTEDDALENIDIGGPCMIRAAAKNYPHVAVVVDPALYPDVLRELKESNNSLSSETRRRLAGKAFARTQAYDAAIQAYFESDPDETVFPESFHIDLVKQQDLRYGENPHQKAALYRDRRQESGFGKQRHGKELSFNNILDLYSAMGLACEFTDPTAIVVKHNNPCGACSDPDLVTAYRNAFETDSMSAFGGIVALNRPVTPELAEEMASVFLEVIVAPGFESSAFDRLAKKKNLRLIEWPEPDLRGQQMDIKKVLGGYLFQTTDQINEDRDAYQVVTQRQPQAPEWDTMVFGWKVAKWVKSNAILFVTETRTLGIGAGQMSRIDSVKLATRKAREAGLSLEGSIMISDAFFPFRDGVDAAHQAGAIGVIQPGGSKRDPEVVQAADEHDMFMVFTGHRHFRH
jgi:phosphoribosylaminoimidazolecarboxamide formyltransferase/IMP cyclohydrolase